MAKKNYKTSLAISNLLPGHGHIFEQLQNRVRHVFQGAEVDAFVVAILARGHVAVVADDLANVL